MIEANAGGPAAVTLQQVLYQVKRVIVGQDALLERLLVALLRRYGLKPYRYPRQRRTTVMARVPARFVDETLWPEFESLWAELRGWLNDATERVVRLVTEQDADEAEVVERPAALGFDPDDDDDD